MIPKVIHYCWFGRNEKPDIIKECINSWRENCPDYQIIEWNEDNFDVNIIPYTRDAYKAKRWAFVSDYARLWVVHEHGGIYMDTDVILKKSLDELLQYDCWFAQDDIRYVNTGLGFGAIKGNEVLKTLLEERSQRGFNLKICNAIDTPVIRKCLNFKQSRESQLIGNSYIVGMTEYPEFARHLETNSWKEDEWRDFANSRRGKNWKLKCTLRNPTIMNWLERNGETPVSKAYVFMVYDFLDNGPMYFIKRILSKM